MMRLGIGGIVGLGACVLFACSSGDDDTNGGNAGPRAEALNPPSNIDASVCASTPASSGPDGACTQCCVAHSFQGVLAHDDHCICGNPLDDSGDTVCAGDAASETTCGDCCHAANYAAYLYGSGSAEVGCTCSAREDTSVCQGDVKASSSEEACGICCLNHGYLNAGYDRSGTSGCTCYDL